MIDRKRIGELGEQAALQYLLKRDYRLRHRNWRHSKSEIDLVLSKKGMLIFVEVKSQYRDNGWSPEYQLRHEQMVRIGSAAARYMEEFHHYWSIRFDLVTVEIRNVQDHRIRHYKDVFFPGLYWDKNKRFTE